MKKLYVLIEQTKYEPIFVNVFTDLDKALDCAAIRYGWSQEDIDAFQVGREYNLGNGFSAHIGTALLDDDEDKAFELN